MNSEKYPFLITDNLFQKSVSCPLKFYHATKQKEGGQYSVSFRHRNKLSLRDAVVDRYHNVKFTSDDTSTALIETEKWLKSDDVVVCGAVIQSGKCLTRIPALRKQGDNFTVIQVHGKLRKSGKTAEIHSPGINRTVDVYLLKAAYRQFVIQQKYSVDKMSAEFFFPSKGFRASQDNLYSDVSRKEPNQIKNNDDLERLFVSVSATNSVKKVLNVIPHTISYKSFEGMSIKDAVAEIETWMDGDQNFRDVEIHEACKYCEYRSSDDKNYSGCWNQFFPKSGISAPEKHVYELIGHGNKNQSENGILFQEQVPLPDAVIGFETIQNYSGPKITIQDRRLLQLLDAKKMNVPDIWIKPGLKVLDQIEYPIHFLDFEAATYAIPSRRAAGPYEPVYFQFSCHTLMQNGKITHSEWLDDNPDTDYTSYSFAKALVEVDHIFEGTIVQYSPFEKQAINNLIRELEYNSMLYDEVLKKLKRLRQPADVFDRNRFLDLNKLIRDSYFNKNMHDKLGLKYVLNAILQWEREQSSKKHMKGFVFDKQIDFLSSDAKNPYNLIQSNGYLIEDGSEAMDAWISMKIGAMSKSEMSELPIILRRYCALDSYALYIIFNHLKNFLKKMNNDDYYSFS